MTHVFDVFLVFSDTSLKHLFLFVVTTLGETELCSCTLFHSVILLWQENIKVGQVCVFPSYFSCVENSTYKWSGSVFCIRIWIKNLVWCLFSQLNHRGADQSRICLVWMVLETLESNFLSLSLTTSPQLENLVKERQTLTLRYFCEQGPFENIRKNWKVNWFESPNCITLGLCSFQVVIMCLGWWPQHLYGPCHSEALTRSNQNGNLHSFTWTGFEVTTWKQWFQSREPRTGNETAWCRYRQVTSGPFPWGSPLQLFPLLSTGDACNNLWNLSTWVNRLASVKNC